jgi:hypothetical protein
MNFTHFTNNQIFPLIVSAFILIASAVFFHQNKKPTALFLLFMTSLGLGFFIANLDHFLTLWDEQYHALVAKNMMNNPLKPMLYTHTLLEYDFRNWTANHVWLHKQPLFLWQIALSLKLFGVSEIAVRIPSIILYALATIMVYRIGRISQSTTVGFYGALFFTVSYHLLELIAGKNATDHNDIAFMFYVTASIWAWFEFQFSKNTYWLILIGLFSGCAVLVKWLVGLLIYAVWTTSLVVTDKNNRLKPKAYFPILLSLGISLLVFIPWQLFILNKYPEEAKYEFQLNSAHFFHAIEDHKGDFWFHFKALKHIYAAGDAIPFILLIGLFLLIKNSTAQIYRVAILSAIVFTYGFYTIAATKMTSYCIIVAPFGFLSLAAFTDSIIHWVRSKISFKIFHVMFPTLAVIVICFFLLDINRIQNYHTDWKPYDNRNRQADLQQMEVIKKISASLNGEHWVVFNASIRLNGHIPIMFYTNCMAYDFIPNSEQISKIKNQSYKIAILDKGSLPYYITQDSEIIKVRSW